MSDDKKGHDEILIADEERKKEKSVPPGEGHKEQPKGGSKDINSVDELMLSSNSNSQVSTISLKGADVDYVAYFNECIQFKIKRILTIAEWAVWKAYDEVNEGCLTTPHMWGFHHRLNKNRAKEGKPPTSEAAVLFVFT